ncbi:MAB_1171c family putative transporter [Streptomyces sp. NPDC048603]|uniref:MAB_1171c family putative transporter n=1 Tax=Streptomyces sp. NPDC048603 TaxID=3365577 RepID=UPI00371F301A
MTHVTTYVIVALLMLQALWRAPAALRGRTRERSLWGTLTAMSLAWVLRTGPGRSLVDRVGVHDLATLLKHVLVITAMTALLRYVTAIDAAALRSGAPAGRRIRVTAAAHRHIITISAVTSAAMAAVFVLGLRRTAVPTAPEFLDRHTGEPAVALYMGLFYLFSGSLIGLCAYQWGSKAREARGPALRGGLWMMTAGMIIGAIYAAIRLVYSVLAGLHPVSAGHAAAQEAVTDVVLDCCFLLWGIGVLLPVTQAAANRCRTLRKTVTLHRMWRDLALAAPDLVAVPPSRLFPGSRAAVPLNTARDVLSRAMTPEFRLGRYITEILDAILELRRRAPEGLYARALAMAGRDGTEGQDTEARAQALWIRAALTAANGPAGPPAEFPSGRGRSLAEEGARLLGVAAAYAEVTPYEVVTLLAEESLPA